MRLALSIALMTLVIALLTACVQSSSTGNAPDGDVTDSDTVDGDDLEGEIPESETTDGDDDWPDNDVTENDLIEDGDEETEIDADLDVEVDSFDTADNDEDDEIGGEQEPEVDTLVESTLRDYYSFVWYAGELADNVAVLESIGAGAILSEGPGTLSRSVHWGRATLVSLNPNVHDISKRDYSIADWVAQAKAMGKEALLSISTGQNMSQGLTYTPYVSCGSPLCPSFNAGALADCPPTDDHWQDWYDFVFDVATHFDGSADDRPEVRYFLSRLEAASPYWNGTKEELLGHIDIEGHTTTIMRVAENGERVAEVIDKAMAPMMLAAVHDANAHRLNPNAKFVIGPPAVFYQYVEMNEAVAALDPDVITDDDKARIVALSRSANFYANEAPACIPSDASYNESDCFAAIQSFFAIRPYIQCHLDVGLYSLAMANNADFLSVRMGEGHPIYETSGAMSYARALDYISGKLPPGTALWDLGTAGAPSGLEDSGVQAFTGIKLFKRMILSYLSPAQHFGYAWLYAPIPLSDQNICLWEKDGQTPWAHRHTAANYFALLARMIPDKSAIQPGAAYWAYFDDHWESWNPADPLWRDEGGVQYAKAIVVTFEVQRRDMDRWPRAHVAAGWCLDSSPWEPYVFSTDCPEVDLAPLIGIDAGAQVADYSANGQFQGVVSTDQADRYMQTFGHLPFLLVWGDDQDTDGVADVIDNCPKTVNPDQVDNPEEGFLSVEDNSAFIVAPDGVGNACDDSSGR